MRTWGSGNFENEGASNLLYEFINPFTATIAELMTELRDAERFKELGEAQIMPMLDIVITLSTHYKTVPSIEPGMLQEWRIKYLSAYDKYIGDLDLNDDFKEERRAIILKTFDNLKEIIEK